VVARYRELAWSPYYKTQIGQQALEPVLLDFLARQPCATLRHGHTLKGFTEDESGVTAQVETVATGTVETMRAKYLIACDGGTSMVRRALGIGMNGRGRMRPNVSFLFDSEDFLKAHDRGIGNLYFIFAPGSFGVVTAIDGKRRWNYQLYFLDKTRRTDDIDPDAALTAMMGRPFAYTLKGVQHWHHHQSVARRWRSRHPETLEGAPGRIFLAGDAAHLFAPTGGVGMNTGIGDAVDLGWKLAATLSGWGGPGLLASYEAERKPIAVRNSVISANNSDKIDMVMDETPPQVEDVGPIGDKVRAEVAAKIRWMARQFNSAGTHLGYRYVASPVIAADGSPEPPDDPAQVVPSTWPGSRAPHAFTTSATGAQDPSTLDWFGREFVLLARDGADAAPLMAALADASVPAKRQPLPTGPVANLFERPLALVRPDGHVAWRGPKPPKDPAALVAKIVGR
ncbi:MAG: FAD-dependent monooxygenase, partial [Pseudomonadota bacterium]